MYSNLIATSLIGLSCLSLTSAAPFTFPDQGSFPDTAIPSQELIQIETDAHGSLPNGPAPTRLKADTLTALQLIQFNEISEVAFFTEVYQNITNNVSGYTEFDSDEEKQLVLASLKAIIGQEKMHALNAKGALDANDPTKIIQPCTYNFPVASYDDALKLAITFTDVVMGTLGAAQALLAADGDVGLIPAIASVIGQEGEQVGAFRVQLDKIPSELPFLTAGNPVFAFSALNQLFVSDCPNSNYEQGSPAAPGAVQGIQIPILGALVPDPPNPGASSQTIRFTATLSADDANTYSSSSDAASPLSVTYINQQNLPVTQPITDVQSNGNELVFTAEFPFDNANQGALFGNGLTIGVLTKGTGSFGSVADVASAAVAGPALFEVN